MACDFFVGHKKQQNSSFIVIIIVDIVGDIIDAASVVLPNAGFRVILNCFMFGNFAKERKCAQS